MRCNTIAFESFDDNTHTPRSNETDNHVSLCGQLLFLSSNDRPVQSLDLAAKSVKRPAILPRRPWGRG